MAAGVILWAEAFGCYLLFAGQVNRTDVIAGLAAAVVAAALGHAVQRGWRRGLAAR